MVILGAANRPDTLDPALLRAGRFERVLEFRLPIESERLEILRIHLRVRPHAKLDLEAVAAETEGWTGADLELVVRRAATEALGDWIASHPENAGQHTKLWKENGKSKSHTIAESPRIEASHLLAALEEVRAGRAARGGVKRGGVNHELLRVWHFQRRYVARGQPRGDRRSTC